MSANPNKSEENGEIGTIEGPTNLSEGCCGGSGSGMKLLGFLVVALLSSLSVLRSNRLRDLA